MKNWYQQWDDFINEEQETKLKSSGNVDSHISKTMSNLSSGQRTEISDALESLLSDKEFSSLFNKYKANPDSLELDDKNFIASKAEELITSQGLSDDFDLPGADAALAFVKSLNDKLGSATMEERYTLDGSGPNPANSPSNIGYTKDDAVVSSFIDGSDVEIKP